MVRQNRRRFLTTAGATAFGVGLAGCTGELREYAGFGDDSSTDRDGSPGNETKADDSTPAESDEPGQVIVDFDDGVDEWYDLDSYGSFEATTDVRNGSGGIRLLAGENEPYVGAVYSFDDPRDLRGKTLSLSFNASSPQIHKIEVQLVAPDQGNMNRFSRTNTGPTNAWLDLDMGTTDVVGEPDLSQVYAIKLIGRDRGQELPIDMVVDEIRLHDAPDQGRVVLTWDDCHATHYRAFEIMQEYGFPGVDGVIHDAVGADDRLDVHQLREMSDAGWDVVSHPQSGSDPLTEANFSKEEQRQIIEDSIDWLESRGFGDGASHYIAPGNLRDATNLELLREYHDSSMSYGAGNTGLPVSDTHTIGRFNGTEPATVKEYVDYAEMYNQAAVVMWHTIGDDPNEFEITESTFRELLDYIENADVQVVTQSDLASNAI